jgi:large subunit ribosomal protein L19
MNNILKIVEADQIRDGMENFSIGDTVKVFFKIIEGKTERIQVFEGLVLCKKRSGLRKSITVRKISYGVGVERTFALNSPKVEKIEVVRHGKVRRAKLYYMRGRLGKAAKITELIKKNTDKKKEVADTVQTSE